MNEMIGYIFGRLKASDGAIWRMQKAISQQTRINRILWISTMVVSTYIIAEDIHNHKQDQRIKQLTNEIQELKRTEGD